MTSAKHAGSIAAKLGLGVFAAIGNYLVCVLVTYLLGGMYYSVTLVALVALSVSVAILTYRWVRRRTATSWSMVGAMMPVQAVDRRLSRRRQPVDGADVAALSARSDRHFPWAASRSWVRYSGVSAGSLSPNIARIQCPSVGLGNRMNRRPNSAASFSANSLRSPTDLT